MRMVKQRKDRDCGVATVAIVAGCTYAEAKAAFQSFGHSGEDTHTKDLKAALARFEIKVGYRCVPMRGRKPHELGRDAILAVNTNGLGWHWVVWDHMRGKILDPLPKAYKRLRFEHYLDFWR